MPHYNPTALYLRKPIRTILNRLLETPLTVVEAPMGYGKTTAVREFAKESGAFVLWKTLDNDSVQTFWSGFSRLIGTVDQNCSQQLAKLGLPDTDFFLDEAINLLGKVSFPQLTLLVIDDYHLLLSPEADHFIETLIKAELPNLHVVVISRVVFGSKITELRLKGYCTLIDKRHFELTPAEIVEYYKTCGVRLTAKQAADLFSYTEGWISALYLCLLSFLQEGRIEHQVSLHDLLEKAVYQQCSVEVKNFLLTFSIFDNFSLEQADALWPQGDAQAILKKLMAQNAFIAYNSLTQTFQLHNILTVFLRGLFERKSSDEKKSIWQAAGRWFFANKDYLHAMEYFYKAADYDNLMTALEANKGLAENSSYLESLRRYFQDSPPAIIAIHPRASLIFALELFANNEYELFAAQCQTIHENIALNSQLAEQEKNQLSGELEFLCSFSQFNRIQAMSAYHQNACRLMHSPTDFFDRNGSWSFESPSVVYMFHRERGALDQEVHDLTAGMPAYYAISGYHGFGGEYAMQAEQHYFCGEFENAEIAAHTSLYAAKSKNQLSPLLAALFVQLRLALLRGDASAVTGVIERMRDEIRQGGVPAYLHTFDLCEGFLYGSLSDGKKIPDWIASGSERETRLPFPTQGFYNIIYGKALLIHGEYAKFLGLATQFQSVAAIFPNLLAQLYTYIYEAAACCRLGRIESAQNALHQALDLAAPDRLLMPFVENASFILPLLTDLSRTDPHAAFLRDILSLHAKYTKGVATVQLALSSSVKSSLKLTAREQEIAELVASGLSNQRIAATLFITEATVKKALQNTYTKLNINSRTALAKIILG